MCPMIKMGIRKKEPIPNKINSIPKTDRLDVLPIFIVLIVFKT